MLIDEITGKRTVPDASLVITQLLIFIPVTDDCFSHALINSEIISFW